MIRGLYTAASSMVSARRELDIISNNLANAGTAGFKRDGAVKKSFPEIFISKIEGKKKPADLGSLGTGVRLEKGYTDFSQGRFKPTGNNLDLAIEGKGFFVVQTPEGRGYTRNGNFTLDNKGQIVTQAGYPVLGETGPVKIEEAGTVDIDGNGRVHTASGLGDRLLIVDFPDYSRLSKAGENLYHAEETEERVAGNYQLKAGHLEESNINIIREMARMIESNRVYEANQKVITSFDQTLDKAVNSVGRTR